MSEFINDKPAIKKQIINEVMGMLDDEYVEYQPGPRHLDEIFQELREAQALLSNDYRYPTLEMAIGAGQRFANDTEKAFKAKAHETHQKMIGEVAILSGDGLVIPKAHIDFVNGESYISPSEPGDEEEVLEDQMDEVIGLFRGVGFLVKVDEGAQTMNSAGEMVNCPFYTRLYYKLQIGAHHHPLGDMEMFALGEIGVANLVFEQDAEQQAIFDALSQLLSNDSMEVAELVNELNQVLACSKRSAKDVRKVGKLTKKLHALEALRPEDSHAILDLITAYISPYGPYKIGTSSALEYQAGNRDMEFDVVSAADNTTLLYEQDLTGIVLADEYDTAQDLENVDELVENGKAPYFVLERDDVIVHIPMSRVRSFGPGTY